MKNKEIPAAILAKLPGVAFVPNHENLQGPEPVLMIKRGVTGCYPVTTRLTAKQLNDQYNIKPEQAAAMRHGSMFGWDTAPADPDYHLTNPAARRALWLETWPCHCKACQGWGGKTYQESHGFAGGGTESIFDPCEAIEDAATCHRCGKDRLDEDGEGPCSQCGWNYDDGVPTVDEPEGLFDVAQTADPAQS